MPGPTSSDLEVALHESMKRKGAMFAPSCCSSKTSVIAVVEKTEALEPAGRTVRKLAWKVSYSGRPSSWFLMTRPPASSIHAHEG